MISIVIPVFNEEEVLPELYRRLRVVLDPLKERYQLVFVDDGSVDNSLTYLKKLSLTCYRIKVVQLSRNFGKEAALMAGLENADGKAVIILDADLQDPPELIPEMLEAWREGASVVTMKRRIRDGETWCKKTSAYIFYRFLQKLTDFNIPNDTGDFRLISREVVNAINLLPERNRYTKGLFAWVGFDTTEIEYDRDPRAAGETKWSYFGLVGLAFEAITSFSVAPLRWATMIGSAGALGAALFGFWQIFKTIMVGNTVDGYTSLIAIITFFGGLQLLFIGIVGEYVGKTYFESKQRPLYLVESLTENKENIFISQSIEKLHDKAG